MKKLNSYLVGGAVRDELLGLPIQDRDFVVVGATVEQMLDCGFKPIGRDFPVFLHPTSREEYALARTERKSGEGHQGFTFHTSPKISLEDDLERRDLTINAIAKSADGTLIDPFGGLEDLKKKILRHISSAFAEDPLRVLRTCRFVSQLDFEIHPATMKLISQIVRSGEIKTLSPERIWNELGNGLMHKSPSKMVLALIECGALYDLAPELKVGLEDLTIRNIILESIDRAARQNSALEVRTTILMLAACPDILTANDHTKQIPEVNLDAKLSLLKRLRAPKIIQEFTRLALGEFVVLRFATYMSAEDLVGLLTRLDAIRKTDRLEQILIIFSLVGASSKLRQVKESSRRVLEATEALKSVDHASVIGSEKSGEKINRLIYDRRVKTLREKFNDKV